MLTSPIMNMFGRSPIRPLEKHMDKAHACAKHLIPFFEAVFQEDWELAEKERDEISILERKADELKRDLRLHLPKGLFMPVARSDLLELLHLQDAIANKAKDIAGIIVGRRMQFPNWLQIPFSGLLHRSLDATLQADKAINELDELLETGFRGNEVTIVEEMISQLDQIEHDTDSLKRNIRHQLFKEEKNLPPIDVIFLYKIIDYTGELADCAQRVGGHLLILLAR